MAIIQSIQPISITIGSGATSNTATISSVTTANTIILWQGVTSTTTTVAGARYAVRLDLTNSTTVTATRGSTLDSVTVNAVVVEFGSGVNSIQAGTITVTSPATSNTATISSVGSTAFVLRLGTQMAVAGADYSNSRSAVELTNSTTVTAYIDALAGNTQTLGYMVVDLDSTIVAAVEKRAFSDSDASTSDTETITSAATTDTLLIWNGIRTTGSAFGLGSAHTVQLTNATTTTLTRSATAAVNRQTYYTVVRFASTALASSVQRGTIALAAASSNTATITSVNTSNALVNYCGVRGASGNPNVVNLALDLTNATTVTGSLNSAGTVTVSYEVIEFAAGVTNKTLTADAGSYSLLGTDATPELDRLIDATAAGSYSLTGSDAGAYLGRELDATGAGSYSLLGTDAATTHQWKLDATTAGSYALTGTDVTLTKTTAGAFSIAADTGSYSLVGTDATLTKTTLNAYSIVADLGSYLLTGTPVTLISSAQPVLPIRGEWPEERKRRRKRDDTRQEVVAAARAARDALKASLERLYDGGEYDAPVEVLEEAQTEALAVVNALTRLPDVPVVQLQAAEQLIRNIQELLRQRQLDEAQTEVATAIARQHLVDTIDIATNLYQRTRYDYLARVALLTAE